MRKKLGEDRTCISEDMIADKKQNHLFGMAAMHAGFTQLQ